MSEVRVALQELAEQAEAQVWPPALADLRRRRTRRAAVRGAGAVLAVAAVGAAAVGTLAPGPSRAPDVVAAAPPSATPAASPGPVVPAGKVVVPPASSAGVLVFPPGAPPLADLLSSTPTPEGSLVTAGQRRGDDACTTVFVAGVVGAAQGGGASCGAVTGPGYRAGRLELLAGSSGPSGDPVTSVVLHGSAPAGTRTLVLTGAQGTIARVEVASAGPQYAERAYFAVPWVEQDTVAQALDAGGRVLTTEELLLAMGGGGPTG